MSMSLSMYHQISCSVQRFLNPVAFVQFTKNWIIMGDFQERFMSVNAIPGV
jgi:hypothetical protein